MKKIKKIFVKRYVRLFLLSVAGLLFLPGLSVQPVPKSDLPPAPPAGRTLVEMASKARDDLNRALHLLEKCFGHPVDLDRVRSVPVTLTAYSSSTLECDDDPHLTASSVPVRRGTIAVSRDLMTELGLAFGQKVLIPGYGIFEVQDLMHSRWRRMVDIWYDDRDAALLFGRQPGTIMWVSTLRRAKAAERATTVN